MRRFLYCMMLISFLVTSPVMAATLEDAKIQRKTDNIAIHVTYPVLDQVQVRDDIQRWANLLAENFWLEYRDDAKATTIPFELLVDYTLSHPSANILSIAWEISSYTGGAHGALEIVTMTYDLRTGALLDPLALFADPNLALEILGSYSRASLTNTLGSMLVVRMLNAGTEPSLENFSAIALTPAGVRIYFQPYQVAPWASGAQIVNVPLADLQDAGPDTTIWKD